LVTWSNRISVAAFGAPARACSWSSMAHHLLESEVGSRKS
jgi:hypothetical protein